MGRHAAPPEIINGYVVEDLARALFDARKKIGPPATDEQWEIHALRFPDSHRILMQEARREAEDD